MKTKNTKFQFQKYFNKFDVEKFPNGWVTKSEITKLVLQDIASNDDDKLINKILLIPPNIWGNDELRNKYLKNEKLKMRHFVPFLKHGTNAMRILIPKWSSIY